MSDETETAAAERAATLRSLAEMALSPESFDGREVSDALSKALLAAQIYVGQVQIEYRALVQALLVLYAYAMAEPTDPKSLLAALALARKLKKTGDG